ncbi:MAG TPA: serine/threonine protein kinase [Phycisphaerales bacterium]|nr:serine/threonine protein kinase [Phycisphaerales bacterium]
MNTDDTYSMDPINPDGPPTASESLAAMPEYVGNYKLTGVVGQGGMGIVYKAKQENPHRDVAIKVLRPEQMTEKRLQRFEQEGELLGKLNHPAIAKVYEVGLFNSVEGKQPFIAMELIEGQKLLDYVESNKLTTEEKLVLLEEIGDGVAYAHQQSVVHRDLKPSNIMVTNEGHVQILDFGVASSLDSENQLQTMLTDVGQLVGTLTYMSPEQASGNSREVDTRSDVYALGGIAYKMLSGNYTHAVNLIPLPEAIRMICEDVPALLGTFSPEFKGDIETIVGKALEKDKERRYKSVSMFVDDIQRHRNNEPIEARPPSTVYVLSRFAKRNKVAVTAACIVAMTLILATVFSAYKAVEAREATVVAEGRLEQIQQVATTLIFDLTDRVGNLPGATPLREYIAMTGLETLRSLEEEAVGNDDLAITLAKAWQRLGDIFGNPHVANLGRTQDALDAYVRAENVLLHADTVPESAFAELKKRFADMYVVEGDLDKALQTYIEAKERAQQPESQFLSAEIDGRIASVIHASGKTGEATVLLRKAVNGLQIPTNGEETIGIVRLMYQLGELEKASGRAGDAAELFANAKRLLTEFTAVNANNQSAQELLAEIQLQLGEALFLIGDVEEGISLLKESTELHLQLTQNDPFNIHLQDKLARTFIRLAIALYSDGQVEKSLKSCDNAIAICRKAIANYDSRTAKVLLAKALLHLANIELQKVAPERAVVALEESLDLLGSVSNEGALDKSLVVISATVAAELAEAIGKVSGDPLVVVESMLPSLELLQSLSDSNPDNIALKGTIINVYIVIRTRYMDAGKLEEALAYSIQNVENAKEYLDLNPTDSRARRTVSVTIGHVGEIQSRLGRHEEARVNFDRSILLLEELIQSAPNDAKLLRSLSFRYSTVGDLLRRQGEYQNALNYYLSSKGIDGTLVELEPSNIGWLQDLAISNQRIADTYVSLQKPILAIRFFIEAISCTDVMRSIEPDSAHVSRIAIATEGRFAEFVFADGDFSLSLEVGIKLRDRSMQLRQSTGDRPYDRTLWTSMEALVGRSYFELALNSTLENRDIQLQNALDSLSNAIVLLQEMESEGTAQSYNVKLLVDTQEVKKQVLLAQ